MKKLKILILIPARYESSRFQGKPLALIHGKPMVEWVYNNCNQLSLIEKDQLIFKTYIVTDDIRIETAVKEFGGNCLMVKDDVISGTQRISLAYDRYFDEEFELIINVQGDEPLIKSDLLLDLVQFHLKNIRYDITTVITRKNELDKEEFENPNMVKVIFDEQSGNCQYFSRAPIPYVRDFEVCRTPKKWYHHIGIYCFRPTALKEFSEAPPSYYEEIEKLEQLRAFDLGHRIGAIKSDIKLIGVDIKEDIKKLEEVMSES